MNNETNKITQNKASDKISLRQAMLIFTMIIISPAARIIPALAAKKANQAGWVAPLFTVIFAFILLFIYILIYKKFKTEQVSLMDICYKVFGNVLGKIIVLIYLLYITILAALYLRYFGERLVSTILGNVNINLIIIPLLLIIAYIFKKGIVTFARMIEILLPIILIVLFICFIGLIPILKIKYFLPVSTSDIGPIFNASIATTGIFAYFTIVFFMGDKITNISNLKKSGIQTIITYTLITGLIIFLCIGTVSYYIVDASNYPFLIAVKQIEFFKTFEKFESIIVAEWVVSDFSIIIFFIFAALNMLKTIIKTKEEGRFSNIYIIFIYILCFVLAGNTFEMVKLSSDYIIYSNILLFFGLPLLILIVGKIRKKI